MRTGRSLLFCITLSALLTGAWIVSSQDDQASRLLGARPVKDFVVHGPDFMLKGDTAYGQPNGQYRLEGILVETRRGNELNLIVETPFCVYNASRTNVRSSSTVSVRSADDRFRLSGDGYSFFPQAQEMTILSNVTTRFDRRFFYKAGLSTNLEGGGVTNSELTVTSHEFEYKGLSGNAEYRGFVQLADGNGLTLDAGMLRFNTSALTNITREIRAIENVRVAMKTRDGIASAMSQEAIMSTEPGIDGRAVLIGNPQWQQGLLSGKAGVLSLLVISNQFDVLGTNKASMRIPSTFFQTNRIAGESNKTEWVDVNSEYYRLTPGLLEFHDGVTLVQSTNWTAKSEQILAFLDMTNRQPTRVEATGDFRFMVNGSSGSGEGRADDAEFRSGPDGRWLVSLTGRPEWTSTEMSTTARTITVLDPTGAQEIVADGDATLTLSGELLAGLNWFSPKTNSASSKNAGGSEVLAPVEIVSDNYDLNDERVVFNGNVTVSQSTNSLETPRLTIWFTPDRKARKLYAERGVTTRSGASILFAQTMTALFDGPENSVSEVRAIEDVDFKNPEISATGKTLVFTATTSELVLGGDPVVIANRIDNMTKIVRRVRMDAPAITMNLTNKTVSGSAPFTIKTLPEEPPNEAKVVEPTRL